MQVAVYWCTHSISIHHWRYVMATHTPESNRDTDGAATQRSTDMRDSPMMRHLLEAAEAETDIGEYGRLVLGIVGRHFLSHEELAGLLASQPDFDDAKAAALLAQIA